MRRLPVAREGWLFIVPAAILTFAAILIQWHVATMVLAFITMALVHFFRDPYRAGTGAVGDVLAPADGVVTTIHREVQFASAPDLMTHISIMSSLFDVQVNRAPIGGRVTRAEQVASTTTAVSSEERNQQSLLLIENEGTQVGVRQFGGLMATRVVLDKEEGDIVARGERIGMITFGSRVDLLLPAAADVVIEPGQRVRVGLTVVARLEKKV